MMKPFRKLKAEATPIAVIVVFFVAFFWPAFFSGMCFVGADSLVYFYPMRDVAWKMIRDGALPLWTPHIISGFPLLAMTNLGIGYPLTWGYLFLPGHIAEEIYVLAPYLLAPAFVYAYLRTVNCSRLGSLLGGLSFTYGGMMVSGVGQCGLYANAVMWLPLMLIAIERARTGRFLLCLSGAGAAYSMSVLTGVGPMFVYVGLIAVGYGAFLGLTPKSEFGVSYEGGNSRLSRLFRFRPLAVGLGSVAIGAGMAAFQIFETMQAHRLSQRRAMSYETFSGGSFGPLKLWQSFINPIYVNHYEVSAYVAPLVVVFALVAVVAAARSSELRLRVWFWLLVAALGLLLILGDRTPLYRLLYHIPMINKFRHPWRHTYEWTLGASMLAAFGWDVAARFFAREPNDKKVNRSWRWGAGLIGALPLACCVAAPVVLILLAGWPVKPWVETLPTGVVALAKLAYTLLLLAVAWWAWRKARPEWRGATLAVVIMFACFWEQHMWAAGWWFPQNKLRSDFAQVSQPLRFLEGLAPVEGRIYTSWVPWVRPDFRSREPHNLTARHGFHNAAGYEPLIIERYGQVFGGAQDYNMPVFDDPPDPQILDTRWQGLNLLNVRFVIQPAPERGWTEKDSVRFASADAARFDLAAGSSATLVGAPAEVDTISLVTIIANSTHLPQGATVADLIIHAADGRRIERQIKAGTDTAEWAYESPEVKSMVRHSLPRVYAREPGADFPGLFYWTKFDLGEKTVVDRVELKCVAEGVALGVFKVTLYDSSGDGTFLLTPQPPALEFKATQEWTEKDGVRFASAAPARFNLAADSSATLAGAPAAVDTLSLVTVTANSTLLPQGAAVANLVIHTADGRRIERQIRAGVDTAEWAYERPDVKRIVRHSLPRVYSRHPGDSFSGLLYWTKFDLGGKMAVDRIGLKCVAEGVTLGVLKATLYDSSGEETFLLTPRPPAQTLMSTRRLPAYLRKVYDQDDMQIYENPRALPRVWMVPRVEVVSAEESLRRVRGESQQPFNPRETVLLELNGGSRTDLPQGDFKAPAEARVVSYGANRLAIETVADKSAVLVASEVNYPGWEATIDGRPAEILTADYLLRGLIVPEGRHRVEMRYTAPAARRGAIISALTLLALAGMVIFSIRSSSLREIN